MFWGQGTCLALLIRYRCQLIFNHFFYIYSQKDTVNVVEDMADKEVRVG